MKRGDNAIDQESTPGSRSHDLSEEPDPAQLLRCSVRRICGSWQFEAGETRRPVLRSPDRRIVVGAAHAIARAYDAMLVIYDMFQRIEARYVYRGGVLEPACIPAVDGSVHAGHAGMRGVDDRDPNGVCLR